MLTSLVASRMVDPAFQGCIRIYSSRAEVTRSSATAEKQRVSYPHGGGATLRRYAPSGYIYMRLVEFETHNKRTAVH